MCFSSNMVGFPLLSNVVPRSRLSSTILNEELLFPAALQTRRVAPDIERRETERRERVGETILRHLMDGNDAKAPQHAGPIGVSAQRLGQTAVQRNR